MGSLPQFPLKEGVNMKDIKVTEEGVYSYTKRADGEKTIDFLKEHLGSLKKYSIMDGTGNIGGDTILFGLHFKEVQSIELDEDNFEALKHNVALYNLDNVHLHHGDTMKIFSEFPVNILYLDPPWGGPDYKLKKQLDLYLGYGKDRRRLDLFLRDEVVGSAAPWKPEYIVLKLPFNYNMFRFNEIAAFEEVHVLKIRSYRIVLIKVKDVKEVKAAKNITRFRARSKSRSKSRSRTRKAVKAATPLPPETDSSEW
jgi:hypothetical protein